MFCLVPAKLVAKLFNKSIYNSVVNFRSIHCLSLCILNDTTLCAPNFEDVEGASSKMGGDILVWACLCVCPLRLACGQERLEIGSGNLMWNKHKK